MPTVSSTCPMPATKKTRTTTDHEPRRSAPGHSSPVEPAGGWIGMISRCRDRTTGAAAGRAVGRADARSRAALKPAAAALLADCQLFGKGVMDSRPRGCGAAVVAEPECNRPLATMSGSGLSKAIAQHFQHLAGRLPRRGAIHLGRGERSARGSASSRGLLADVRGTRDFRCLSQMGASARHPSASRNRDGSRAGVFGLSTSVNTSLLAYSPGAALLSGPPLFMPPWPLLPRLNILGAAGAWERVR